MSALVERLLSPPVNPGGRHQPARPSWDCQVCAGPWPCPAGRTELHGTFAGDKVGLSMHMGVVLHLAVHEISPDVDGQLFGRFVTWTR
ncbi:hypothetical protein GA0074692_6778 [Micromonospora pallida]|uniref:Flavin reductase n=1 Tax=Micromonospora pallida TaxID=145854 RepID=A0A1C6TN23_9ACTN|nr:hypothetical protein [Micromonospora pallida]SCL43134.1 hypothetical protein GA0074692_6727 [Micromonospora pallida]SCL43232.1 hypothetical protein GA0074692_6778 [Micromonospora pallida]